MLTSTPFKSSNEVYEWISTFINFERVKNRRDFKLDRVRVLAEAAGRPERCAPSIHVAGSKGKGSVTGMIAAILEASGTKTARYASPHVSDFRERISTGSGFFDEEIYVGAGNELKGLIESLPASFREDTTFFELFTLWFFLCARRSRCEAMAVETGMGGRLDATNILDPLVSVITLIELEHTEYLGNTVAAIAAEKAGIIKSGKPLVLAEQAAEALQVFRAHAVSRNSPLLYFPECAEVQEACVDREGTRFTLALKGTGDGKETRDETLSNLFVPIPGEVQAKNAGLAVLALKAAFPGIRNEHIYSGLAGFTLPGRFERISVTPPVIIDGAHTAHSVETTVKTFVSLYGGGALIFGCAAGKDVLSMAELCVRPIANGRPLFPVIIITTPGTFKKSNPKEIYDIFIEQKHKTEKESEILFIPDTAEAIATAKELALKRELPILGTGSFYLAAEIRAYFKHALLSL
ncbi:MAG: tetrahydrofolate synthase [Treponema sp.]|nr:tetrahydrofolate synthase [Treponema sp.]